MCPEWASRVVGLLCVQLPSADGFVSGHTGTPLRDMGLAGWGARPVQEALLSVHRPPDPGLPLFLPLWREAGWPGSPVLGRVLLLAARRSCRVLDVVTVPRVYPA